MNIAPKRRKSKDNPYTIYYNDTDNKYVCLFKDNKNHMHMIEISLEIYNAMNEFELEDISQMHKYDKHIEHSELFETTLYKRMISDTYEFEKQVEQKILMEIIKEEISQLPELQKERIKKYFFDNMTLEEIAKEEKCSKVAVKYSIDIAINKISKNMK